MSTHSNRPAISAEESLQRLVAGNARFLKGKSRNHFFKPETAVDLTKGQHPFATILGCSDSRVPPEVIFDAGMGELFVVRVAGNVISPEVGGSLQYAGAHLQTPLLVILGHEGCGAITAALEAKYQGVQQCSRIQMLLDNILPNLPDFDPKASPEDRLSQAVENNVRWAVRNIWDPPEGQIRMTEGRMKTIGAIYEIGSGRVRFFR